MTIRIEEKTLSKAYKIASKKLKCNISKIDIKIIKHPSNGFIGMFKRSAIIDVSPIILDTKKNIKDSNSDVPISKIKQEKKNNKSIGRENQNIEKTNILEKYKDIEIMSKTTEKFKIEKTELNIKNIDINDKLANDNIQIAKEIEFKLKTLVFQIFHNIDIIEVDISNKTAYVFIDGEGIAMLIGSTGYGYDASIYFLSFWLRKEYNLYLDLEIGEYKKNKLENLNKYLIYFAEQVRRNEKYETKIINRSLISNAIIILKRELPDKYIKIKFNFNRDKFLSVEKLYRK